MLLCKFCTKECKNDNSLRNHERLCKLNPDKQISWLETNRASVKSGNNATRAHAAGIPFITSAETRAKQSVATKSRSPEWKLEHSKQVSKTITEKVSQGKWHTSLARRMHIDYNGVDLHGTWEHEYVKFLDDKKILWVRNKDTFPYEFEGKTRRYTPDFYLPDCCTYIEIKGYMTCKDVAKWNQFPSDKKLISLLKKDLIALGVKIKK
jgi:hypothetical protein